MPEEKKRVYIETYGCQMNAADTEVVLGLLHAGGYEATDDISQADAVFANTCSVRENAEQRIYGRLGEFKRLKKERPDLVIGVLGCMAERLRARLTSDRSRGVGGSVDLIVGPDEYRKLPDLLRSAEQGERGIAVRLSRVETYEDIAPLRTDGVAAFISVMRGCDKFCSFCVVPFTRGRERSRSLSGIVREVRLLSEHGFREVTLLGQNVNSYRDDENDFSDLLRAVAEADPSMRVRFTTSHPQDMSERLIETIAAQSNICKFIHLPVQSGSDRILGLMNRSYDTDHYLRLVERIRRHIPGATLSTDIIAGFSTETEDDHNATMALLEQVRFDGAFMFRYSPRENTPAFNMRDDVPDEVKSRRVGEIIALQNEISLALNRRLVGTTVEVLVEGESKKSPEEFQGRTDGNRMVVFPRAGLSPGDHAFVTITRANSATLFGLARSHVPAEATA